MLINLKLQSVRQTQPAAVTISVTDYLTLGSQLSDRDPDTVNSTSEFTGALLLHLVRNRQESRYVKEKVVICLVITLGHITGTISSTDSRTEHHNRVDTWYRAS